MKTKKTKLKAKHTTTIPDTNASTFLGKLDRPVQVNLSNDQKELLVKAAMRGQEILNAAAVRAPSQTSAKPAIRVIARYANSRPLRADFANSRHSSISAE